MVNLFYKGLSTKSCKVFILPFGDFQMLLQVCLLKIHTRKQVTVTYTIIPTLLSQTRWTHGSSFVFISSLGVLFQCLAAGLIRLRSSPPPHLQGVEYVLNVTAEDDNASGGPQALSSTAQVIVGVDDVNNNKPVFEKVREAMVPFNRTTFGLQPCFSVSSLGGHAIYFSASRPP